KSYPALKTIEVAFDLYVAHVGGVGGAPSEHRAGPLQISCVGGTYLVYSLQVGVLPGSTDYGMTISTDRGDEREVSFANRPDLKTWNRVVMKLGLEQPAKPVVMVGGLDVDLVAAGAPFAVATAAVTCAVRIGVGIGDP